MRRSSLVAPAGLALVACGAELTTPPPACGDGVVSSLEQCDDANVEDGDGCSATCELEPVLTPVCVDLLEANRVSASGLLATTDGRLLLSGSIATQGLVSHGWVGAFDTNGEQLWSLDLEDEHYVHSMIPRGDGVAAVYRTLGEPSRIIDIDATGNVTGSVTLVDVHGHTQPSTDILDTDHGVLLAGGGGGDMRLARLGPGGEFETLMLEDYAGFADHFNELERHGDRIGAMATIGVANHGDPIDFDIVTLDIQGVMLLEYDEQGVELHRTVITGDDEHHSLTGFRLGVTQDGTWIITGSSKHLPNLGLGTLGWAAAVRDGELLWSLETPGSGGEAEPYGFLSAIGAGDDSVLVAGRLHTNVGVRRWAMLLSPDSGDVIWEQTGAGSDYERYMTASTSGDGPLWLSGNTERSESVKTWVCSVEL
ncbi:hypothetical protein ENSA5_00260 [Enhygromyxa salina]|uniref:Uncharacterized protein n=1 Tax=Enhygromyxa salina TaxID=215803 RepID=A0A2S9YLF5_9BACT|nr:myxococcus cysteine-rich repeat containing protein [Enhygromyxa salina]PRQ05914.1 hypothetical protein ENSA5_00260 [Enhygromyxa salina]